MSPLDAALRRLQIALGALEDRMTARDEDRQSELELELQIMGDDRSRLAVELESATARLARVEAAADHVGQRVARAVVTIRDVLAAAEDGGLAAGGRPGPSAAGRH